MSGPGSKLTFANVVAVVSLAVALGGTGYAVGLVTSQDIKNGTIVSADVKDGGLRGIDLARQTLKPAKLAPFPYVSLAREAPLTTSAGSERQIPFDVQLADPNNMWTSTRPTLVCVPRDGIYVVSGQILWDRDPDGARWISIGIRNSTYPVAEHSPAANVSHMRQAISSPVRLLRGQCLHLSGLQTSGGRLGLHSGGGAFPYRAAFSVAWIGNIAD